MPANIKTPYTQTPYDILSDPNNPKVGMITPDTKRVDIRNQYGKVVVARVHGSLEITGALNTLLNVAGRLKCDAFLITTLNKGGKTSDEIEQYQRPEVPPFPLPEWTAGLPWLHAAPQTSEISRLDVKLEPQDCYNLPEAKPPVLGFES